MSPSTLGREVRALKVGGGRIHIAVRLTRVEGQDPPYDHNFLLGSAVYKLLKDASHEAANILHDSYGRSAYVLSEIHRVRGKPKEAWFRVGTSHDRVLQILAEALAPNENIRVGATTFKVQELSVEEPAVRPGRYFTISPILLRDPESHRSIVRDSPDYHGTLQAAINRQIQNNLGVTSSVSLIHVIPQAIRKRTIDGATYLAQKANLTLHGKENHLRFLVDHGIGSSPALGFGMILLDQTRAGPWIGRSPTVKEGS